MAQTRDLSGFSSADLAVLDGLLHPGWPDAWCDFARMFFCGLLASKELKASRDVMARAAIEQVRILAHQLGGTQIYIPRGTILGRRDNNDRIRQEFKGNNYGELASRYDLSESRVRQVVKGAAKPRKRGQDASGHPKTGVRPSGAASPFAGL